MGHGRVQMRPFVRNRKWTRDEQVQPTDNRDEDQRHLQGVSQRLC
jgi:hypothetical protein